MMLVAAMAFAPKPINLVNDQERYPQSGQNYEQSEVEPGIRWAWIEKSQAGAERKAAPGSTYFLRVSGRATVQNTILSAF